VHQTNLIKNLSPKRLKNEEVKTKCLVPSCLLVAAPVPGGRRRESPLRVSRQPVGDRRRNSAAELGAHLRPAAEKQTAYRILVASSPELLKPAPEIFGIAAKCSPMKRRRSNTRARRSCPGKLLLAGAGLGSRRPARRWSDLASWEMDCCSRKIGRPVDCAGRRMFPTFPDIRQATYGSRGR